MISFEDIISFAEIGCIRTCQILILHRNYILSFVSFQKTRSDKEINTLTNKIKKLESLCRALQQQGRGVPRPQADTGMLYYLVVKDANRVATAQGKQGIWFLLFPDRENTGNLILTQGKIC